MSSYYPRFKYLGINSQDKNLIVANLDGGDSGEADTFLSMDPIYTDSASGAQRLDYGAKFNDVAVIKITTIRQDGGNFSVEDTRDCLKWITGSRTTSPLDLVDYTTEEFEEGNKKRKTTDDGKIECTIENQVEDVFHVYIDKDELSKDNWTFDKDRKVVIINKQLSKGDSVLIHYSKIMFTFIGRVTNAWHYKMDARTIGVTFEFTSVSPWAYSPVKTVTKTLTGDTISIPLPNESDDVDTPVYVKTTFTNMAENGSLTLVNTTFTEEQPTTLTGLGVNETIIMDSNQMITNPDNHVRVFGNNFNFVFPRLRRKSRVGKSEDNIFSVSGKGDIKFEYVVPIKAGDCIMNVMSITNPICDEVTGNIQIDTLDWSRISGKPTTLSDYGLSGEVTERINDAITNNTYTQAQINNKFDNIYTKSEVYTKEEIQEELKKIEISDGNINLSQLSWTIITDTPTTLEGYGITNVYNRDEINALLPQADVEIDEDKLNEMLAEVLG